MNRFYCLPVLALAATLSAPAILAQGAVLTAADYARAESRLSYRSQPLIDGLTGPVTWMSGPGDHAWYTQTVNGVTTYMLLDAVRGTKTPAFDNAEMARGLQAAGVAGVQPGALAITSLEVNDAEANDVSSLVVTTGGNRYACAISTMTRRTYGKDAYSCTRQGAPAAKQQTAASAAKTTNTGMQTGSDTVGSPQPFRRELAVLSPDGKRAAYIRNWNLWVHDMNTGEDRALTTDGVTDFGYATDNAGWQHSDKAVLVWSPDSKKIATFQQDQRKTGMMYLVSTNIGHPTLSAWRYPMAGDKDVTTIQRVIIDADSATVTRLKMPADQHRSSLCDDLHCERETDWPDVQWSADAARIVFVSTSRDHTREDVRMADAATGNVREVMHEDMPTTYESGIEHFNWRYLSKSNEILWYSERSNWGHLYLYDATTGKLKRQITRGDWNAAQLLQVDEAGGTAMFAGVGKEAGWDPYYKALYRVDLNGREPNAGLRLLTPEPANHTVTISTDGRYFTDVFSTPQTPPVAVLRDAEGKRLVEMGAADASRLTASGWHAPESFTVKARDGKTDLYGLMFKPSNFDPTKKYPIIDYVYPNPIGSVGPRNFATTKSEAHSALAELGFIVVEIDGMGTWYRSRKFLDEYHGDMSDNTLPDQVTMLKQLGAKYAWIDMNRIGIWGHSGGGFATAGAMLRYPDFFKVGWSESGNHDNRTYEDDWGEPWMGLESAKTEAMYQKQANAPLAANLKGKLMLVHGTMDDNVPPNNTLVLVDALMKAGKDFDMLMVPNARHGYGERTYYIERRQWDYFVENLMGATPPKEYPLPSPAR